MWEEEPKLQVLCFVLQKNIKYIIPIRISISSSSPSWMSSVVFVLVVEVAAVVLLPLHLVHHHHYHSENSITILGGSTAAPETQGSVL